MTKAEPPASSGPPASAGGDTTPAVHDRSTLPNGATRVTLPVAPAVRRAYVWANTVQFGRLITIITLGNSIGSMATPIFYPHNGVTFAHAALTHLIIGVALLPILMGMTLAIVWLVSRTLQPVTIDIDAERVIVTRGGHRPRSYARRTIHAVRSVTWRRASAYGALELFGRYQPVASNLWHAPVADLANVVERLTSILGTTPNKAADGIGGSSPGHAVPPMASAALLERP